MGRIPGEEQHRLKSSFERLGKRRVDSEEQLSVDLSRTVSLQVQLGRDETEGVSSRKLVTESCCQECRGSIE